MLAIRCRGRTQRLGSLFMLSGELGCRSLMFCVALRHQGFELTDPCRLALQLVDNLFKRLACLVELSVGVVQFGSSLSELDAQL